ncbi:MAG: hypothetical protein GX127_07030 [Eubacteriaceae bacterium]|jgi:hypothetical protein|nr:hypothetical protein [Eubacteriaceae bacterium]
MKKNFFLTKIKLRIGLLLVVAVFVLSLSACGNGNAATGSGKKQPAVSEEALTPIVTEMDRAAETIESVSVKTVFIRDKNIEGESKHQEQWMENNMVYGPDASIPRMETKLPVGEGVQERLDIDGQSYLRSAGRLTWIHTTTPPPETSYSYFPVYEEFKTIASKMSLEETETDYVFTFEGEDAELYQTLLERYKLRIDGAPEEAVHLKLKYVVAKDTNTLVEVHNTSEITSGEDSVHLQATIQYTAINPALDLQAPAPEAIIQP